MQVARLMQAKWEQKVKQLQSKQRRQPVYDRYITRDQEEPANENMMECPTCGGSGMVTQDGNYGDPERPGEQEESDRDTTNSMTDRRTRDRRPPPRSLKDLNQFFADHYKSPRTRDSEVEEVVIHNHMRNR
jgi:hypothetical protein